MSNETTSPEDLPITQRLDRLEREMIRQDSLEMAAFRRLYEYVEYKAAEFGITTKQVDPAYTSQRCSKCGHTERGNRPTQERFCCRKCGYEVHADYNAAKNIGINTRPHGAEILRVDGPTVNWP